MSRFDRYLLSHLLMLFGFFSLVLVSVYWVNRAVSLFDQLIGDGQSAIVFLEFTLLTLPNVIRLVLPISAFVAAVYVTNRLSNDSELLVMQASGVSGFRLARPVLIFGLVVALLLAVLMNALVPASRAELSRRSAEIAENVTARFLSEGRFLHPADGITLFIDEITPEGELRNLMLVDARGTETRTTYTAQRALLVRTDEGPRLVMIDGMAQSLRLDGRTLFTTRFSDFTYDIGALIRARQDDMIDMRALSTGMLLRAAPETQSATGQNRAALLREGHERLAQPFLAPAAAMIGFATLLLGAFSRFGVTRQIVGAIVLLVIVQMANNAAGDLAGRDARLWPFVYIPPLFGGALALALLWMAGRPRRRPRAATGGTRAGAAVA